jgi:hypothetical protein
VGHQGDVHRQLAQDVQCLGQGLRGKTQAVHAGIQLQANRDRRRKLPVAHQQFKLLQAVDDRRQAMFDDGTRVARAENPFQQQDGLGDAGFAQGDGVFAFEHGEAVGYVAQRIDSPPLAVAIGIRLDDGPGAGMRACCLARR